ncbi:MAG: hypothetical protein E6I96_08690 [Chloroflexi bacterium]|nr:MAG: hypothetical protein E6I96_08690 [Chloroflexota bacterium]
MIVPLRVIKTTAAGLSEWPTSTAFLRGVAADVGLLDAVAKGFAVGDEPQATISSRPTNAEANRKVNMTLSPFQAVPLLAVFLARCYHLQRWHSDVVTRAQQLFGAGRAPAATVAVSII